jgi:hypothetical protein
MGKTFKKGTRNTSTGKKHPAAPRPKRTARPAPGAAAEPGDSVEHAAVRRLSARPVSASGPSPGIGADPRDGTMVTEDDAVPLKAAPGAILVRATAVGDYLGRRRLGDVFELRPRDVGLEDDIDPADRDEKIDVRRRRPVAGAHGRTAKERIRTLSAEDQFNEKWMERV